MVGFDGCRGLNVVVYILEDMLHGPEDVFLVENVVGLDVGAWVLSEEDNVLDKVVQNSLESRVSGPEQVGEVFDEVWHFISGEEVSEVEGEPDQMRDVEEVYALDLEVGVVDDCLEELVESGLNNALVVVHEEVL